MGVRLCMTVTCGYTVKQFRLVVRSITVFNILDGAMPVMLRQHQYIVCLN